MADDTVLLSETPIAYEQARFLLTVSRMKNFWIGSVIGGLALTSIAYALPLAMNTASTIILDGSKVTVAEELMIPHDFPQFYIQAGKIFGSTADMDDSKPSCLASFSVNHKDAECSVSDHETITMGPTKVAAGTYSVTCGKSDPSLRGISLIVLLGAGKTLRLECVKDSLIGSREHLAGADIRGIISNEAISFR
jgi:hypothetical protein